MTQAVSFTVDTSLAVPGVRALTAAWVSEAAVQPEASLPLAAGSPAMAQHCSICEWQVARPPADRGRAHVGSTGPVRGLSHAAEAAATQCLVKDGVQASAVRCSRWLGCWHATLWNI